MRISMKSVISASTFARGKGGAGGGHQPKAGALLMRVTVTARASSANERFPAPPRRGALTASLRQGARGAAPHMVGQWVWHPSATRWWPLGTHPAPC